MMHDVNFNELTTSTAAMTSDELAMCVDNLREFIKDGKAQWDKVAAILQVNGDDFDAVVAAARTAMAGMGGDASRTAIQQGAETFPAFGELHRHVDAALMYELERFHRRCDELAEMSLDQFIEFKNDKGYKLAGERRWWRAETQKPVGFWQRVCNAIVKWTEYGRQAP